MKQSKFHPGQPERGDEDTTLVEWRNAVLELLRSQRSVDKVFVAEDVSSRMKDILALARQRRIVVTCVDRHKLDAISRTHAHQGVIAQAVAKEYVSLSDILEIARQRGEKPLLVLCDGITDPHNLGAVIRSAETAGAHGVVIPKRRACGLTAVVAKTSAGAVEHMAVARVTNLAAAIDELKSAGVWTFCAAADGERSMYQADWKDSAAIVIGSEGEGVSRLVREKCDFIVSIPMKGRVSSLNVSAAAAVLLYEAVRQRA